MAISSKNPKDDGRRVATRGAGSRRAGDRVATKPTMKCETCGAAMTEHIEAVPLTALPSVIIDDALVAVCENGHRDVTISQLPQRLRWVALRLIEKSTQLTGEEIRFLRKHLGFSATDFAAFMEVKPETVSRWENEKLAMSGMREKTLRIAVKSGPAILEYEIRHTKTARPMKLQSHATLLARG